MHQRMVVRSLRRAAAKMEPTTTVPVTAASYAEAVGGQFVTAVAYRADQFLGLAVATQVVEGWRQRAHTAQARRQMTPNISR